MRFILTFLSAVLLTQCGAPSPPECRFPPLKSRTSSSKALASAKSNWEILADPQRKADWVLAEKNYNDAVLILFDQLRCGTGSWSERAAKLGTSLSAPTSHNDTPEDFDAVFPASQVRFSMAGRYNTSPGLGIAAVAWKSTTPVGVPRPQFYPPNGQPRSLTVVLDFNSSTPQWFFSKRWIQEMHPTGKTNHQLTADWTAPIDFYWHMSELDDLRIENVLLPERFATETGLYFLQPYDPNKIPVVMVHGLISSPDAYRYILNDLSAEPWFRENYQVWLYNYPTGTPWLYNAMRFRQNMEQAAAYARSKGPDTKLEKMVILTHSMGGLITRTAVTDPGTKLYDAHYNKTIDQLPVKEETRNLLREGLLYKPFKTPDRIVFMAVPHQGSPMADLRATSLLSNLIKLPKSLTIDLLDSTLQTARDSIDGESALSKVRPPTSLNSLSTKSPGFVGLKEMPLPSDITFHSIVGNWGNRDIKNSTDGVVPFWSSSISPVASEKIIPANHSVPDHPEAAKETKRILLLHLRENNLFKGPNTPNNSLTSPLR
jgi:pimeloyl-ACP methyl ester carboxylesterase